LLAVKFADTHSHVLRQHEPEKRALFAVELRADRATRIRRPFLARQGRERVCNMGENVKEIAVLRVEDLLHFGKLLATEALLGESRGIGAVRA